MLLIEKHMQDKKIFFQQSLLFHAVCPTVHVFSLCGYWLQIYHYYI